MIGEIGFGLLILLGVMDGDTEAEALMLSDKISRLRIFSDETGRLNRSILDVGGSALVISNFTLAANYTHGNRPDYFAGAAPEIANALYERFISLLGEKLPVQHGEFGADMQLDMLADGPVTIVMDTDVLKQKKR
jgi:D-tyrosyl-tRNA(Tyr) deacylase